jgi:glycosyltransferase involved in cell wall biosynthesis
VRIAVVGPLEFPGRQGGMTRHIEEVYARLAAAGHHVTVFCRRSLAGAEYRGMHVRSVPAPRRNPLDRIVYSALASILASGPAFDVVHYHSYANSGWSFVPWLRRRTIVMTVHRLEWLDEKWGPVGRAVLTASAWITHRVADAFIAVSAEFEELVRDRVGSRSVVRIPNGVTVPDEIDDGAAGRFGLVAGEYLLVVARLVPEKGVDVLLDALDIVAREGAPLALPVVVAGQARQPTPYSTGLTARAERAPSAVRFLGVQPAPVVHALYRDARALVAPSRREGNPLTVMEAMVHGTCVVASDIPPHRELLGDAGVFVDPGDAAQLASALGRVAADPAWARTQGQRARARIEQSTDLQWDGVAARTEAVLTAARSGR